MSQKIPLYYSLPAIILSALVVMTIVMAWTEPPYGGSCADPPCPPGGNVPAPLNIGSASQYKSGALGVGGVLRGYSNAIFDVNVGIGTASPSQKLHVVGNARITGLAGCNTIDTDVSGNLVCGTDETGAGVGYWTASGSNIYNSNTGNVGIGTASPSSKLHVNGEIRSEQRISLTGRGALEAGTGASDLSLYSVGNLYINPGGNVGIGTASPSQKLHVVGNARITGLAGCNTIDTDVSGNLVCGTDERVVGSPCYDIQVDQGPVGSDTYQWFVCNAGYTVTGVYYVTAWASEYSRLISIRCCK